MAADDTAKNQGLKRLALENLKAIVEEMLGMPADQVMWNHINNLAAAASSLQDELNGTQTEIFHV
jgi:hypothetical protein